MTVCKNRYYKWLFIVFFVCVIESKILVKFKVMRAVMNCLCCRDGRCSLHILTFTFDFLI